MWSNPCFELWILLHFGYTTAPMATAECLARASGAWQKAFGRPYEKNDAGIFDALRPQLAALDTAARELLG